MTTLTTTPSLERAFLALSADWLAATRFSAAPSAASAHPSYRAIIAMGWPVIPFILIALADSPDPWFQALREISGDDPVPPADQGRPEAAANHWLKWNRTPQRNPVG